MDENLIRLLSILEIKENDLLFKKCIKKIPINKEVYNYKDVANYRSQIGMMIPKGFICVDVDNMEAAILIENIILKREINCIINNTVKGKHFIFRSRNNKVKQQVNMPNLLSINSDTRTPGKGYIILPNNTPGRSYHMMPNNIDEVPFWLIPDKDNKKLFLDGSFMQLGEGNRDNSIYKFIMQCKDNTNLNYDQMIELLSIINDYVLKDPMDFTREILPKVIEDEFKEDRVKKSKQQILIEIGKSLIEDLKVKKYKGTLYYFTGVTYQVLSPALIKHLILKNYWELMPTVDRNEVVSFISDYVIEEREEDLIYLKDSIVTPDSIVNLKTLQQSPNDGSVFVRNSINYNFNINTPMENKFVDEWLGNIFRDNPENVNLIYQMIGYSMLGYLPFRKSFYLYGPAGTGKSFLVSEIMYNIFGGENVSLTEPETIEKDIRMVRSLENKLLLVVDEGEQQQTKKSGIFKKLVSGERIEADVKGTNEIIRIKPSATTVVTTNHLPSFADKSSGISDRILILDFKYRTSMQHNFIENFTQEHMEYIVFKSILWCNKILEKGGFIIPENVKERTAQVLEDDNNILIYIKEVYGGDLPDRISVTEVYEGFKTWCITNSYLKLDKKTFNKGVCDSFGVGIKQTTNPNESVPRNITRFVR